MISGDWTNKTHLVHVQEVSSRRLVVRVRAELAAAVVAAVRDHVHGQGEDGADLVVAQTDVVAVARDWTQGPRRSGASSWGQNIHSFGHTCVKVLAESAKSAPQCVKCKLF